MRKLMEIINNKLDLRNPIKTMRIRTMLPAKFKEVLVEFLKENSNVFD